MGVLQASGVAETVGSLASVGDEKLASVPASEKKGMRDCVTNVAKNLVPGAPSLSDDISMLKFGTVPEDGESVDLPKPANDATTAPKLKMKTIPKDKNGNNVPPSVAVFNKKTAAAIFPKPSNQISDEDNAFKVEDSLSSNVVSVEVNSNHFFILP